jgi:hypothetical protein
MNQTDKTGNSPKGKWSSFCLLRLPEVTDKTFPIMLMLGSGTLEEGYDKLSKYLLHLSH